MAISDSPEAVFFIDMSDFTDKAYSERVVDIQTGWLSLPAGGERDAGAKTKTSMGPGKMLVHERDKRLFVSNFNANTISVFDLETGVNGTLIAEMPSGGENPYAMALSPDGNYLIVSNYTGDVHGLVANSTVSIFDIQPNSPNEFSLVTQVVNK
jgi:DNA-binding beta-propeller fold protein YncE